MSETATRILIIDDSPEDRAVFRRFLSEGSQRKFVILEAETGEQGYALFRSERPDCVLLDYNLPDFTGLEILERLNAEQDAASMTVVMLTGVGDETVAVRAMKGGAQDYLAKNALTARVLQHAIETAMHQVALERELELKRREVELQRRELEQRNRDLETLLYVTSHDLREPLRAIQGFSKFVLDQSADRLDEKSQDYLRRVVRGADRLDRLLEDVLMLSRAQRMDEPNEELEGRQIVAEALRSLEAKIRETNARFQVADELPSLRVSLRWATQAVYNLVANAIKFTREGEIPEITISGYRGEGSAAGEVGIVVADRGIGVAPEHAERIFLLFQRAVGREIEGTGAGLAIVSQIAERHGGRAWVRPRDGGGSEFIITFRGAAGAA